MSAFELPSKGKLRIDFQNGSGYWRISVRRMEDGYGDMFSRVETYSDSVWTLQDIYDDGSGMFQTDGLPTGAMSWSELEMPEYVRVAVEAFLAHCKNGTAVMTSNSPEDLAL